MKAVSLWQPWASAIALRLKKLDTRGWSTAHRGQLAIHAAKRWTGEQLLKLRQSGIETDGLPMGAIVAVCDLIDVEPSEVALERLRFRADAQEEFWGDYGPGRWVWVLENVQPLPTPLPWKGKQGFFNVPDELILC